MRREVKDNLWMAFTGTIVALAVLCIGHIYLATEANSLRLECLKAHPEAYSCSMQPDHSAFDKQP